VGSGGVLDAEEKLYKTWKRLGFHVISIEKVGKHKKVEIPLFRYLKSVLVTSREAKAFISRKIHVLQECLRVS